MRIADGGGCAQICGWIEEDPTQDGIATDLIAAGVPHEAIVLGFQPPDLRPLTEFAAA